VKHWHKHFVALSMIMAVGTPAIASARDLEAAMALYRSKQYEPAAAKFVEILRAEPKDPTASFYAAYSYYGAGKIAEAKNMFWYLVKHCSTSREAYSARALLKNIDKAYAMDSSDPNIGVLPPASEQELAHVPIVSAAARKEQIIANMIVLTPRRSLLDVTPVFVDKMRDALREYPLNVLQFLHEHNCKMVISPNVIETDFRMQNSHPGG
jgi:tetratricopeptide (TPR) repeat protein